MYLADRFRDALKDGGIALFVGVGPEQLPVEYRTHPRVTCWDSDAPQLGRSAKTVALPARVRVVVMSRFTSHAALDKVQKATKKANAVFMGKLSGTGEMARLLREALPVPAPPKEIPTMHVESTPAPADDTPWLPQEARFTDGDGDGGGGDATFKTMSEAIRHYARRELHAPLPDGRKRATPLPHAFYETLATKLQGHGFTCTATSVVALFSMQRAKLRQRELAAEPDPTPLEEIVVAAPPVVAAAVPAEPLPPDLDAMVQMAADLDLRGLQAIELADQLRRLVAEQRGLRVTHAKYEALRAIVEGPGNG